MDKTQQNSTRKDWEKNHVLLTEAFKKFMCDNDRAPTQGELAKITGLNRGTVNSHIKNLKLADYKDKYKLLTNHIIEAIAKSADRGSAQSQKLFMQLVENWSEKLDISAQVEQKSVNIIVNSEKTASKIGNLVNGYTDNTDV